MIDLYGYVYYNPTYHIGHGIPRTCFPQTTDLLNILQRWGGDFKLQFKTKNVEPVSRFRPIRRRTLNIEIFEKCIFSDTPAVYFFRGKLHRQKFSS